MFQSTGAQWIYTYLLLDRHFPRSVHFCVMKANESLHAITGTPLGNFSNKSEQRMGRLNANLDFAAAGDIVEHGLHEFIDGIQIQLNEISEVIQQDFFSVEQGLAQGRENRFELQTG